MSKSSNDDINVAYLEKLADAVSDAAMSMQKISESYGSNGQLEQTLRSLAKSVNDGTMTTKQLLREAANTQKNMRSVEYGLESTTKYNKTVNMFIKLMEERLKNSKLDEVLIKKLTTAFENLDVTAILESEKIGQRGGKGAPLKNVMDNEKLGKVNEDLARRIGVRYDNAQYKLINFFQNVGQNIKKGVVNFGRDLIEGLEKSRWVGGALRDTFRLIGLLGANWLQQFGKLGKILGGAFYVAMELAGPTLVKLLLQGMGKLLLKIPSLIGRFGWGNAAGVAIGAAGAMWAFDEAKDSERRGRKGNAAAFRTGGVAMGAGAAALGVTGLATLGASAAGAMGATGLAGVLSGIAAALGPIGWTLLAIGGAVAGIAVLWKNHSETIKKWAGKFMTFVNKVIDFMAMFNPIFKAIQWIRDNWPFGEKGNGGSIGGNNPNKGTGIADSIIDNKKGNYVTYGKMKVSKRDGSILNLSELSQDEASAALQAYEKADPTSFNRVYEWVAGDKASLQSHSTDAVKKVNGKVVAALSKKGTSQEVEDLRNMLMSMGMSKQKASEFVQTSGKLTGSNTQHSVGGWKSHNNQYGLGIDLAGGQSWTGQDYLNNYEAIKQFYRARGFEVALERPGQGKSTGWHYDIKPASNFRPTGAMENFSEYESQQKAVAEQRSIALKSVAEFADAAEVKRIKEQRAMPMTERGYSVNLDEMNLTDADYRAILKKHGIYEDKSTNTWMRETDKGIESLWYDNAGNMQWRLILSTMQGASQGSTGR